MMKKMILKGKWLLNRYKKRLDEIVQDEAGEGFLDVIVKILITVIIGAALLALLKTAIPDLFQDIIDKINSVFTI